jgi:hypothetical protein
MILFLKATVPGGARSDLFATPVDAAGYTTKEGVYDTQGCSTLYTSGWQS